MIPRYTRPEMGRVWSEENKYRKWLEVEIAAAEAWARLGRIPAGAVEEIRRKARIDLERIGEIEAEIHHDVVAFTTQVAETVGDASRYIHFGLTSTDVVDTAQSLLLREAVDLILRDIDELMDVLREQAARHKDLVMMGRTHGVHAEPTTLGLKFALWLAEMERNRRRIEAAGKSVAVGKISGSTGTYANVPPEIEAHVCERLGLERPLVSTQVLQRDRHAELLAALAICGGSLEKFAVEIRGLQRTEIREVEEPFRKGQKGSSSMPHKRNPEKSERISGLARLLRGNALAALENQALWHERDISHSSVERVILPDSTILLDYMLHLFTTIVRDLHVYPDNMQANLEKTRGLIYSQRVLLALVEKGLSREEAYEIVQGRAMEAWEQGSDFRQLIRQDPEVKKVLSGAELDQLFDPAYHVRYVDEIFKRLGIEPTGR